MKQLNHRYYCIRQGEISEAIRQAVTDGVTDIAFFAEKIPLQADPHVWGNWLNGFRVYHGGDKFDVEHVLLFRNFSRLVLWSMRLGNTEARAITKNLPNLKSLSLSINLIGEAGTKAIAENLPNLNSLDLSNNSIGDAGAKAIAENLLNLDSLDLSNNSIGDAGAKAIAENLPNLNSLSLGNNSIGEAGAKAIAENLPNLNSLSLGNNSIGDAGAKAIAENLPNLNSLSLGDNSIGDAGAEAIAENLPNLNSLSLGDNSIGDAGAEAIAENLPNLNSLSLGSNSIGDAGAKVIAENLPNLDSLGLSYTKVTDLSPFADRIRDGMEVKRYVGGLAVAGCKLVVPPMEVVKQGPDAVRNYFLELEEQGTDRLFEAKVLILGEGEAGKTSLLRRLYCPGMPLPKVDETTRGIDILRHDFQCDGGRNFRLNVWDFGGQQIYHATHQFFLTKNSLYILVDDTKKDDKSVHDEGFKYWLEVVEVLSDSSPVIIFQNEKGGRGKTIDEGGIKGRFPNVKEVHRGNLEEENSADGLSAAIRHFVQQLHHIGETVPAQWVTIREAVESRTKSVPYISQEDYFDIYREHLEFDRKKALHLSRYLHDLGVFLHFQDDMLLQRTVILQNRWATEAVFKILDDEHVKSKFGRFTEPDCQRLWQHSEYADMHPELLGLMEKFELCYRLGDAQEPTWLAPQLLSPSRPTSLDGWAAPSDLSLNYRYTFLPKGLVSRLMVRMHRFVRNIDQCWAYGALFEHQDTHLLVETLAKGDEIVLRARGPEKKALLSVVSSEMDALNATFQGLEGKVGKWVPCTCSECAQSTSPHLFEQKDLLKRKQKSVSETQCHQSYQQMSVLELLDGLQPVALPDWAQEEPLDETAPVSPPAQADQRTAGEKTVKIFLASSAELRDDRDQFDLYLRQQNDRLRKQGLYLKVVRWENYLDAMSETRLQDVYNREVGDCDLFVALFKTKTGKFTEEEFDVASESFHQTGKPLIYTYFRSVEISIEDADKPDVRSLVEFKKKLQKLGHYHTSYTSIENLKRHFRDQLDELRDQRKV